MTRVLLVWSVHQETGHATAAELQWLLGRLRPEVLFLEHSATDLSTFLDGSCDTLESAAVRRYRTLYPVELVPVDLSLQSAEFKQKADCLFQRIEETSPKFYDLDMRNRYHTDRGGFAYLNSPYGAAVQSDIQRAMRDTVEDCGDPSLAELYTLWSRANDLREEAMLDGVETFSRGNRFTKGVLLVGAAHSPSIFKKVQARRKDGSSLILWDFDWSLESPSGHGAT